MVSRNCGIDWQGCPSSSYPATDGSGHWHSPFSCSAPPGPLRLSDSTSSRGMTSRTFESAQRPWISRSSLNWISPLPTPRLHLPRQNPDMRLLASAFAGVLAVDPRAGEFHVARGLQRAARLAALPAGDLIGLAA